VRAVRSAVSAIAAGIAIIWLLAGCGASAREKTLSATFVATHAAAVELTSYADRREGEIVKDATSADDGRAKLAAFRAKVDHAEKAIDAVYELVKIAALLKDEQSLAILIQAAITLTSDLKDMGVVK
jgi:hypothetical protein